MSEQSELKRFTRKGLAERNTKTDAVFVIDNVVYDVTKFLDDHPGGHEVLLNVAGKDASEDFDDVGHSTDAKEMMKKYIIGELVEEDKVPPKRKEFKWSETDSQSNKDGSFLTSWKFPVVLGLVMTVLYSYLFG
ncbi:cytochrome b5-like [Maniola hyperantus]|uniref:cytochrome b5-like n=1 Tax=Aphantopus hyperantus TaxID=2795564 RepID=UPI00156948F3|nr:cytochrome b5-like [Maniola hyperantus]